MTTQLRNPDPFAPMDNGDFIAQMAQFSTVTGIEEVNASLGKLVEEFDSENASASITGPFSFSSGNMEGQMRMENFMVF